MGLSFCYNEEVREFTGVYIVQNLKLFYNRITHQWCVSIVSIPLRADSLYRLPKETTKKEKKNLKLIHLAAVREIQYFIIAIG